jgi:hypothetical protein
MHYYVLIVCGNHEAPSFFTMNEHSQNYKMRNCFLELWNPICCRMKGNQMNFCQIENLMDEKWIGKSKGKISKIVGS